jgi:hypothetical protein
LKLPNFVWGFYPVFPAIPASFTSLLRVETSAPARRFAPKEVQVYAFSSDSDSSTGLRRLMGPSHLRVASGRCRPTFGGVPFLTVAYFQTCCPR